MSKFNLTLILFLCFCVDHLIGQDAFFFETYNTDDNLEEEIFSDFSLPNGAFLDMTVSGTYSVWSSSLWSNPCGDIEDSPVYQSDAGTMTGYVGFDMKYIFSVPGVYCEGRVLPEPTEKIQISLDNGETWFHPESNLDYDSDHTYTFQVVGQGFPIGVKQLGPENYNDYGKLKFSFKKSSTSSTNSVADLPEISVYPNPVRNQNINIQTGGKSINKVEVFDATGRKVGDVLNGTLPYLQSGVHYLRIYLSNGQIAVKRIIAYGNSPRV